MASPLASVSEPSISNGTGWNGGYSGVISSGHISALSMKTVVPTVTCQPKLAEAQFVGIQAGLNGTVSAVGMNVLGICDKGSSTPVYTSLAADCYADNCTTNSFSLALSAGDRLSYGITINATGWIRVIIDDLSTGGSAKWAGTVPEALKMNGAHWTMGGPNPPCTRAKCAQALAEFSSKLVFEQCHIVVSGATVPISGLFSLTHWTLVDSKGRVLAKTSTLTNSGTRFTVSFLHST
jgi:hypothetical protein